MQQEKEEEKKSNIWLRVKKKQMKKIWQKTNVGDIIFACHKQKE